MDHVIGWMSGMTVGDKWVMTAIIVLTVAFLIFLYKVLPKKNKWH